MAEMTLPPVAKTVHLECKKCACERYFVVVAHTSATSAKVKCEVCGSQKTYKLPSKNPQPRQLAGAAAKRKEAAAQAKKNAHSDEYNNLMASVQGETSKYSMKSNFPQNTKISHPKFGDGFVRLSYADKIEVVFSDEVRSLVHNRQ
ncbi:MAG: hypothetical protein ACK5RO_11345 [Pseudobdellovibrionaceae bacterium]|jgi:hypothetical protein